MQLSAPTLPIDPNAQLSADGSGFPSSNSKGDASVAGRPANFGAMLSAESRGETSDRSPANANDSRPRAARVLTASSTTATAPEITPEILLAANGLVVPPALPEQAPIPTVVDAEIDFTFTGIQPRPCATGSDTLDGDNAPAAPAVLVAPVANPTPLNRAMSGRPVTASTQPANFGQQSLRAYSLSSEGRTVRTTARPQTIPEVKTPAETSPVAAPPAPAPSLVANVIAAPVTASAAPLASNSTPTTDAQPFVNESTNARGVVTEEQSSAAPASLSAFKTEATAPRGEVSNTRIESSPLEIASSVDDQIGQLTFDVRMVPVNPTETKPVAAEAVEIPAIAESLTFELDVETKWETPAAASETLTDGVESSPIRDHFTASFAVPAKIAARFSRNDPRVSALEKPAQKYSLAIGEQKVVGEMSFLGINAAKPENLMPTTATAPASTPTSAPAPVAIENASLEIAPLSFDALVKQENEGSSAQLAVARRAVESILNVAEQLATSEQRSVRLQFTVGGEELAVRVEFRGDKIHTTFRTDSSELRSALAHEWQSVSAVQNGVRTQRLADPVFASNSSGNGQSFSSDSGSAHHRDSGQRHAQPSSDEIYGARRAFSNTTTAAPAAITAAPVTAARILNPLRLHTFA